MRGFFAFFLLLGVCCTFAQTGQSPPTVAPVNSAFIAYQQSLARGERPGGLAPSPVDVTPALKNAQPWNKSGVVLPSFYDLRSLGRVTPAKYQFPHGTCWAHAIMGSLESRLLPEFECDLSENHLVNMQRLDRTWDQGGGNLEAMAYLARWEGPVFEADDPYPNPGNSPSNLPPRFHVQDAFFTLARNTALDNDAVKEAMMTYGGLYAGMYWDDAAYDDTYHSHYYTGTNSNNHAILLVGWDDDFPSNHFVSDAPGNGAFIVKNSFGTNWAEAGYFYASYYDPHFAPGGGTVFNLQTATNYTGIYQYDPLGWVTSARYTDEGNWAANLFTSTSDCPLRAVAFYTPEFDCSYELRIYRSLPAGQPSSGSPVLVQTGSFHHMGYHTVPLMKPIGLLAGERFSVIVNFPGAAAQYPLVLEFALEDYSSSATAEVGQSFFGPDGIRWEDLTLYITTGNFCIKAFTGPHPNPRTIDYDGEGTTDLAVYQPGTGRWYGRAVSTPTSAWVSAWGAVGMQAVPGDFDGDSVADPAVFHEQTGTWYIRSLKTSAILAWARQWGARGMKPVVGDFDGDGCADLALYQEPAGKWYITSLSGSVLAWGIAWGGTGLSPVPGDYDGDGRTEFAVYARTSGMWYIRTLEATILAWATPWGSAGFIPVAGDYDGDGLADLAVYGEATGAWYIQSLQRGVLVWGAQWGAKGLQAVSGDYNGDGIADLAVYGRTSGAWFIRSLDGPIIGWNIPWGGGSLSPVN